MRLLAPIGVLLVAAACATTPSMHVTLDWRPTNDTDEVTALDLDAFAHRTFVVAIVGDERSGRKSIGQQVHADGKIRQVTTEEDAAAFVLKGISQALTGAGVTVTQGAATHRINVTIAQLFVAEAERYTGRVLLRVSLMNEKNAVIWTGNIEGSSSRWGDPGSDEAYQSALSDAVISATVNLMKTPGAQQALR